MAYLRFPTHFQYSSVCHSSNKLWIPAAASSSETFHAPLQLHYLEDVIGISRRLQPNSYRLYWCHRSTFITLVPKKDYIKTTKDRKPICLLISVYKIITKVLAIRFKLFMDKLILPVQCVYIEDRDFSHLSLFNRPMEKEDGVRKP
ncbi:uncharacterized protein LOC113293437 isoform X2 [Papaver somniferum]|uniref:uncharacterized protein LOC113293437 isoform X2 n=1 Tax=Papaver somniferum TaxID=3469 RepID=UPI000E6FE054|nr:uncharacterized protein LOC113293437 isoform X2 [Papaver somniferum]